jgi:hypothetical protein
VSEPAGGRGEGMPRWVVVSLVIVGVVAIALVLLVMLGGHGPGNHL